MSWRCICAQLCCRARLQGCERRIVIGSCCVLPRAMSCQRRLWSSRVVASWLSLATRTWSCSAHADSTPLRPVLGCGEVGGPTMSGCTDVVASGPGCACVVMGPRAREAVAALCLFISNSVFCQVTRLYYGSGWWQVTVARTRASVVDMMKCE